MTLQAYKTLERNLRTQQQSVKVSKAAAARLLIDLGLVKKGTQTLRAKKQAAVR